MHEENFSSSWLRVDLVGKEERKDREKGQGGGKREYSQG